MQDPSRGLDHAGSSVGMIRGASLLGRGHASARGRKQDFFQVWVCVYVIACCVETIATIFFVCLSYLSSQPLTCNEAGHLSSVPLSLLKVAHGDQEREERNRSYDGE